MSIKPSNNSDHKGKNRNAGYKQDNQQKEDKNQTIIYHYQNLLFDHQNQNRQNDEIGQND